LIMPSMMTTGILVLLIASLYAASAGGGTGGCWEGRAVFHDIHDGDYKIVTVNDSRLTITPNVSEFNHQTWIVESTLDAKCQATIDFNVKGKPNPPPCNLTATIWNMSEFESVGKRSKIVVEFTDPTGQINPDPTEPINEWVETHIEPTTNASASSCWEGHAVLHDIQDGDSYMDVTVNGNRLTLTPHTNTSDPRDYWIVESTLDDKCIATIDFNCGAKCEGYRNPPPCKLTASIWDMSKFDFFGKRSKIAVEITINPDQHLLCNINPVDPTIPVNEWVETHTAPASPAPTPY